MDRQLLKWGLALFIALCFFSGCASNKKIEEKIEAKAEKSPDVMLVPQWMAAPPKDERYFYAAATATSKDVQLALDKATADARVEIGRQVEVRILGLLKRFKEETGHGEDAQLTEMTSNTAKLVVSNSLSGSRIKEQKFLREGSVYRAYSLVEYPTGAASQELLAQIKNQKEMYTRFRGSEAFKGLDEETKRFEEWKRQQAE